MAIPTGLKPCDLDRTADGQFAYVPEREQDTVAMIEIPSLRIIKRYDMGKNTKPHMLRVAPDNKAVRVANGEANSVVVLDAKTLAPVAKIAMGKVPVTFAFSPDGQFAYIRISVTTSPQSWTLGRSRKSVGSRSHRGLRSWPSGPTGSGTLLPGRGGSPLNFAIMPHWPGRFC